MNEYGFMVLMIYNLTRHVKYFTSCLFFVVCSLLLRLWLTTVLFYWLHIVSYHGKNYFLLHFTLTTVFADVSFNSSHYLFLFPWFFAVWCAAGKSLLPCLTVGGLFWGLVVSRSLQSTLVCVCKCPACSSSPNDGKHCCKPIYVTTK